MCLGSCYSLVFDKDDATKLQETLHTKLFLSFMLTRKVSVLKWPSQLQTSKLENLNEEAVSFGYTPSVFMDLQVLRACCLAAEPMEDPSSASLRFFQTVHGSMAKTSLSLKLLLKTNSDFKSAAESIATLAAQAVPIAGEKDCLLKGASQLEKIVDAIQKMYLTDLDHSEVSAQLRTLKSLCQKSSQEDCKEEFAAIEEHHLVIRSHLDTLEDSLDRFITWLNKSTWGNLDSALSAADMDRYMWHYTLKAYCSGCYSSAFTKISQASELLARLIRDSASFRADELVTVVNYGLRLSVQFHSLQFATAAADVKLERNDGNDMKLYLALGECIQKFITKVLEDATSALTEEWQRSRTTSSVQIPESSVTEELSCLKKCLVPLSQALSNATTPEDQEQKEQENVFNAAAAMALDKHLNCLEPLWPYWKALAKLEIVLPSEFEQYRTLIQHLNVFTQKVIDQAETLITSLMQSHSDLSMDSAIAAWDFPDTWKNTEMPDQQTFSQKTQVLQDALDSGLTYCKVAKRTLSTYAANSKEILLNPDVPTSLQKAEQSAQVV